jgi:hypothetical protein
VEITRRLKYHRSTLLSNFPDLCQRAVDMYKAHIEKRRQSFWSGIGRELEKQIKNKNPHNVAEVARQIGRSRTVIVKRFPGLCIRLSKHWIEQRKLHLYEVQTQLQRFIESDRPQRLVDIANQLKLSRSSLYQLFPQHCRLIADRYGSYLQRNRSLRKEALRSQVKGIAKNLHDNGVYPSVREVEKHLTEPMTLRSSSAALIALQEVRRELNSSFGKREKKVE